jgi:preprotein translocase subunit SecG
MTVLLEILLFVLAVFLILLVLVQRGKGGGLAGALGGMGGQSAFGTKAGDLFTRITIVTAGVWIILCAFTVWYLGWNRNVVTSRLGGGPSSTAPAQPGAKPAATQTPAAPATSPAKPAAAPEKAK